MDLLAPLLYAIAFCLLIYRCSYFRLVGVPSAWPLLAFLLKIVAGIVFWAVYTFYYTNPDGSDAFRYFADAQLIRSQWSENRDVFWSFMLGREMDHPAYQQIYDKLIAWTSAYRYGMSNDCSTIIRINVLISFVSFGSFHVHALFMSLMSFTGLTAMFKAFSNLFEKHERILFFAMFAIPSVVFWTSSLLKEGPLFLFFGILLHAVLRIYRNDYRWFDIPVVLCSFVMLVYVKGYVIIALIPGLIFLFVSKWMGLKRIFLQWLIVHVLCFFVAQQGHLFFRGGDFLYVLHKKQVDFYNIAYLRDAGSLVYIPPITGVSSFFMHYPQAFALTYFRPSLLEIQKSADWIFALENLLLLMLLLLAVIRFRPVRGYPSVILFTAFSFVLVLAAILGNTVPILGAMVRYKAPALPLLVVICVYIIISGKRKVDLAQ